MRATDRLVVGLGAPDRGDDAVGPAVALAVTALDLAGVRVIEREDPTSLIDLWSEAPLAVVVDAVVSGGAPGRIQVIETGADGPSLPDSAWADTGRGGTHAFGLAASIELARALHRLPPRLVLVGVEAERFDHGASLSGAVARALPLAVARVVALVTGTVVHAQEDGAGRPTEAVRRVPR
jgi:hydrogenase maturation protease